MSDARNSVQIWSEIFDGDISDLFDLQDQITGRIANSIGRQVFVAAARDEARGIGSRSWDLVMRGIAADSRPQSLESLRQQEDFFSGAAQLDPENSDAWAWLARAIVLQSTQLHAPTPCREDVLRRATEAAEKAIATGPANARAHLAMSYLHFLRGDFESVLLAAESAITLNRNLANAHNMRASSLVKLGKGGEAITSAELALRLDPRSPQIDIFRTTMGLARLLQGDIDEAVQCFSRARVANPRLARAHAGAAIAFATRGDVSAAQLAAADLLALAPGYRLSQTPDASLPNSPSRYRQFYEEVLRPGALLAGVPV